MKIAIDLTDAQAKKLFVTLFNYLHQSSGTQEVNYKEIVFNLPDKLKTVPLSDIGFGMRISYALKESKITTLSQLCSLTEGDILRLPNIGRKSLREIRDVLTSFIVEHGE